MKAKLTKVSFLSLIFVFNTSYTSYTSYEHMLGENLCHNVRISNISKIEESLKRGADINYQSVGNNTPLIIAVQKNYCYTTEILLKRGADLEKRNLEERTALFYANGLEMATMLVKASAQVNVVDSKGVSPLSKATRAGWMDIAKLFLKSGAEVPEDLAEEGERRKFYKLAHLSHAKREELERLFKRPQSFRKAIREKRKKKGRPAKR